MPVLLKSGQGLEVNNILPKKILLNGHLSVNGTESQQENGSLHPEVEVEAEVRETFEKLKTGAEESPDDIVISGISCRLPESDNMEEFAKNLFDGIDMVTEDNRRWEPGIYGLPKKNGKLKDLSKFDAEFFGVHPKQANTMDPQLRLLLEVTYESIIDAGINPAEVRGSNTGVFVGVGLPEAHEAWSSKPEDVVGYTMTGCHRSMMANRLSFFFNFKGPSMTTDTACSSSLVALEQAFLSLSKHQCDSAIVGGANLCLKPATSLQFQKLGMLSPDAECRSFDESGNGYVRSEGVVVIHLQRRCKAKRAYLTLIYAKTNSDGNKDQGVTFPSADLQRQLLEETYTESGVDPSCITYIEAHGTGTKAGDPIEVDTLADFLYPGRNTPLRLGSVKSNIGHLEPASGLAGIAKVIIATQRGVIPANLHFKNPNPNIRALFDGRVEVVDEPIPFESGLIAVNSFGFGGSNAHVILHAKVKETMTSESKAISGGKHRLIRWMGRDEYSVREALNSLLKDGTTSDAVVELSDKITSTVDTSHVYRGYTVTNSKNSSLNTQRIPAEKRPIWYIFSGMGTQWPGMGRDMMCIPTFRSSIHNSHNVLAKKGINLLQLIKGGDEAAFSDTLNSFVTIIAIQVALVDVLESIGIEPDGMVGHSVGELGCAYADGCLTAEETVLSAYERGRCVKETKMIAGGMAAVGLTWKDAHERCPAGIVPACHNAEDTVTVSGPQEQILEFVEDLKKEGVFARAVNSAGIAFHSHYMKDAAPGLQSALSKLIPSPKRRSGRWICSSVREQDWSLLNVTHCSAEYLVNNLLSPVLFHEALQHVPKKCLAVEIAPHNLLRAILKRSLGPETEIMGLMRRNEDNLSFFLDNIGRCYLNGVEIDTTHLFGESHAVVPPGAPMLAPLVAWDHSVEWAVPNAEDFIKGSDNGGSYTFDFDFTPGSEDEYLKDHVIDGRPLFPATGYLMLAWRALAKKKHKQVEDLSIKIEDMHIHSATLLPDKGKLSFSVAILEGSEKFEVMEGGRIVCSGCISQTENEKQENCKKVKSEQDEPRLLKKDAYKELRIRGYEYGRHFQCIHDLDTNAETGHLEWSNNWVPFMDNMLQVSLLAEGSTGLRLPTRIRLVEINPKFHMAEVTTLPDNKIGVTVNVDTRTGETRAGGVLIKGLEVTTAPRKVTSRPPHIEKYVFIPNNPEEKPTAVDDQDDIYTEFLQESVKPCIDITLENTLAPKPKIVEYGSNMGCLYQHIYPILKNEPGVEFEYILADVSFEEIEEDDIGIFKLVQLSLDDDKLPEKVSKADLTAINMASGQHHYFKKILKKLPSSLKSNGFLLLVGSCGNDWEPEKEGLSLVFRKTDETQLAISLWRKVENAKERRHSFVSVDSMSYEWLDELKSAISDPAVDRVWLTSGEVSRSGLLGLTKCVRKEPEGQKVRCILSPERIEGADSNIQRILNTDLLVNVYQGGKWGSYRHLLLQRESKTTDWAHVTVLTRGDLSSLSWVTSSQSRASASSQRLCAVYYCALNFRDVMLASGKLSPDAIPGDFKNRDSMLGMEFSGVDEYNNRVMGIMPAEALATKVQAEQRFLWKVPSGWSMEQAATVPVAYTTAFYSLVVRGRIQSGDKVLIHSGSGGVGQAAIAVALHYGCQVFTTVGSEEKKCFLLKRFPALNESNIGSSRTLEFENMIMKATGGKGVDVVLNSLSEEKLQASVRLLAQHGRFLEIGKFDLSNNANLGMAIFLKNVSFHGILLDALFDEGNKEWPLVTKLLSEGLEKGCVHPLDTTVFPKTEVEKAFRYMAQGRHIGKVLIQVQNENVSCETLQRSCAVHAVQKVSFSPNKVYIITGGLGGFGLELADWMIRRNACHLILTSRSGVRNGYQARKLNQWRKLGACVTVSKMDVSCLKEADTLISDASKIAPVGGIFHLAMVLRDGFLENQTKNDFATVGGPKALGAMHLDVLSRKHCADSLDWFVTFSSVSSGRGNAGQTNYGHANAVQERVCEARKQDSLPGLAIQWGAIGDVGVVLETMGNNDTEVAGTLPQRIASCLETLDCLMCQDSAVVSSFVPADKHLSAAAGQDKKVNVAGAVAHIMGVEDLSKINQKATLAELGMDSLMGVEVKQLLERECDLNLSMTDIRKLTFERLQQDITGSSESKPEKEATAVVHADNSKEVEVVLVPQEVVVKLNDVTDGNTVLFIVHPIEGNVKQLKQVAELLPIPTYGLQNTKEVPLDSIPDMAVFYKQKMAETCPDKEHLIAGYSFGTSVAYHIAHLLAADSRTSPLVLLDGAPSYVSSRMNSIVTNYAEGHVTTEDDRRWLAVVYAFLRDYVNTDYLELFKKVKQQETIEQKVGLFVEVLMKEKCFSAEEDARFMAESFYRKLVISDAYCSSQIPHYSGDVTLVKSQDDVKVRELGEDYRLKEHVRGSLEIHQIPGDHMTFLENGSARKVSEIMKTAYKL